ncbi:LCP family protein [Paenibacillus glycanilyticus]|uniref:LCP family protein n=1 Tax=Paenibacillus glycanilyticus TaxID=126569 RepID=UPI00203C73AA|nr:LCP family protein [Paenibacillus glycanilyticus]MCM3629180.1 LCP family protein [Paenibacillus glycanilyticus]
MSNKAATGARKKWTIWITAVILILIVLGYFGHQSMGVYRALDGLDKPKNELRIGSHAEDETLKPEEWTGTELVNILLMGGDNRGLKKNESARSDSLLVASINPLTKQARLFSVLRDTYVTIEGHGEGRINTALALGGPNLAMKTAGSLLGFHVQYYIYTDFEGFKSLIDAIDGVDLDVEKDMNYTDNADGNVYDIHLKKGMQKLDGTKALQYVRFRHDAMSDFSRTERQRKLLAAVADKLKSGWNLTRIKQIVESVAPYIQTNLDVSDMLKLASLGSKSEMAGSAQVPPMDMLEGRNLHGASVLAVKNEDKVHAYVKELLEGHDSDEYTAGSNTNFGAKAGNGGE